MKSCLYIGTIRHRRFAPRPHEFQYRIFMTLVDLAELPSLFDRFWLWSARRPALAWFRRADFHGSSEQPLDAAIRDLVATRTGKRPAGPIRLLTHLRFFGHSFNPVSFYYVFDAADTYVETIVAEITNTPWKERHAYVLSVAAATRTSSRAWRFEFEKRFHVSPFMPMDMFYQWNFGVPAEGLHVHMENYSSKDARHGDALFDATLNLKREPITAGSLARALASFPLMTLKVVTLIHWQALKLLVKRVPVHTHPAKRNAADKQAQPQT